MDFKVAGTAEGITALQMDIKITGVTQEIMRSALEQAKRARVSILEKMAETISEPRTELADHAPRISSIQINPDFIGMVIGKGGETIRSLEADYDVQIDIEEDGTILVYATEGTKADAAISAIAAMTKEPEVGDTYTGRVVKTTDFGAFVELKKGTDGLLHVSNVGPGRVAHIEDVMARGDDARRRRPGGRQGAGPHRPQARRQARGRRARLAGDARRAGEGRPAARAASAARRPWPWRPRPRTALGAALEQCDGGRREPPSVSFCLRDRLGPSFASDVADTIAAVREPRHHDTPRRRARRQRAAARRPLGRARALDRHRARGTSRARGPGVSHFIEHLLFKGSARYGAQEIAELFDAMGGELNAATSRETTVVYTRVPDAHVERALDAMTDMVFAPAFEDVDSEREVVLEEIAMVDDNPQDLVHDLAAEAVFGGHPLGRPVIGRAEVIASVSPRALRAYHGGAYVGPNVVLAAAGNIQPRAARRALRGAPDERRTAPSRVRRPLLARRPEPGYRFLRRRTEQYHVVLAGPGIARDDERRYAVALLDAILGGSASSRLFQEIREKRGMAYSVYSYGSQYAETGQVGIYVGTREDNLAECLAVTAAELHGRRGGEPPRRASSSARRRTSKGGCCSRSRARRTA